MCRGVEAVSTLVQTVYSSLQTSIYKLYYKTCYSRRLVVNTFSIHFFAGVRDLCLEAKIYIYD